MPELLVPGPRLLAGLRRLPSGGAHSSQENNSGSRRRALWALLPLSTLLLPSCMKSMDKGGQAVSSPPQSSSPGLGHPTSLPADPCLQRSQPGQIKGSVLFGAPSGKELEPCQLYQPTLLAGLNYKGSNTTSLFLPLLLSLLRHSFPFPKIRSPAPASGITVTVAHMTQKRLANCGVAEKWSACSALPSARWKDWNVGISLFGCTHLFSTNPGSLQQIPVTSHSGLMG